MPLRRHVGGCSAGHAGPGRACPDRDRLTDHVRRLARRVSAGRIAASVSLLIAADTHLKMVAAPDDRRACRDDAGCMGRRPENNTCAISTAAVLRPVISNGVTDEQYQG